jgi:hypothetical protein
MRRYVRDLRRKRGLRRQSMPAEPVLTCLSEPPVWRSQRLHRKLRRVRVERDVRQQRHMQGGLHPFVLGQGVRVGRLRRELWHLSIRPDVQQHRSVQRRQRKPMHLPN